MKKEEMGSRHVRIPEGRLASGKANTSAFCGFMYVRGAAGQGHFFACGIRPARFVALAAVWALCILCLGACGQPAGVSGDREPAAERDYSGILESVFFDVGKGDCILFSNGAGHVLVDAGYEETSGRVIASLQERGVESLRAMIITHYDKDHVGGAAEIAQAIPVETFYLPDYIGDEDKCGDLLDLIGREGLDVVRVAQDQSFALGDVDFYVDAALVAYDEEEKNDNDASLIVEVISGEDEWLLPGDIEEEAIDAFLSRNGRTYDILKMPHHGRREDNTKELIESVSPGIAVITDSAEDEASGKVLKKLEKRDVEVFRTSVDGTITITGNGKEQYQVQTEKHMSQATP